MQGYYYKLKKRDIRYPFPFPKRMDLSTHQGDIPIPINTSYANPHFYDNTATPHPTTNLSMPNMNEVKATSLVRYRECLKNHAASIGGNATDGCGEFMPSGEEGTLEALKCSACNCHRNFHRKETVGGGGGSRKLIGYNNNSMIISRPTPHNMIMPIASELDEMEGIGGGYPRPPMLRKRFRTKFSAEQKEKMLAFAEKVGWRLQKQEESVVQEFCQEIGVKRRVLKVWMHNNKHNLAKKASMGSSNLDERMEGMNV